MNNIQKLALELVAKNISKDSTLYFKEDFFRFYIDSSGQRGHYIIPYNQYGSIIPNIYTIKRVLSFVNNGDEGKEGAVLGVLYLDKCKAILIKENSIEFEQFTIHFNENPSTKRMDFEYV